MCHLMQTTRGALFGAAVIHQALNLRECKMVATFYQVSHMHVGSGVQLHMRGRDRHLA